MPLRSIIQCSPAAGYPQQNYSRRRSFGGVQPLPTAIGPTMMTPHGALLHLCSASAATHLAAEPIGLPLDTPAGIPVGPPHHAQMPMEANAVTHRSTVQQKWFQRRQKALEVPSACRFCLSLFLSQSRLPSQSLLLSEVRVCVISCTMAALCVRWRGVPS